MRKRTLLALAAAVSIMAVASASTARGYGQVQLVNKMPDTLLDLYIDNDTYGCRALSGFTCETMVPEGVHMLTAKAPDGRATSGQATIVAGQTFTYTVEPTPE